MKPKFAIVHSYFMFSHIDVSVEKIMWNWWIWRGIHSQQNSEKVCSLTFSRKIWKIAKNKEVEFIHMVPNKKTYNFENRLSDIGKDV